MADANGTTFSHDHPINVAVTSEEEAKLYVKKGGVGFSHSYKAVTVHDTAYDAIAHEFNNGVADRLYGKR